MQTKNITLVFALFLLIALPAHLSAQSLWNSASINEVNEAYALFNSSLKNDSKFKYEQTIYLFSEGEKKLISDSYLIHAEDKYLISNQEHLWVWDQSNAIHINTVSEEMSITVPDSYWSLLDEFAPQIPETAVTEVYKRRDQQSEIYKIHFRSDMGIEKMMVHITNQFISKVEIHSAPDLEHGEISWMEAKLEKEQPTKKEINHLHQILDSELRKQSEYGRYKEITNALN